MSDRVNTVSSYSVSYSPSGAQVDVLIRLDGDNPPDGIAGYLEFLDVNDSSLLPPDEVSRATGYIVKHMELSLLPSILDLLHRWIDVSKRQLAIAAYVDNAGTLGTVLGTTDKPIARERSHEPKRAGRLTFDQVKTLVAANKKTMAFTDECVIAVCWKESSFDPDAQSSGSTAAGLMQMTNGAIDTVNRITPAGVHFEHADMFDAAKAIQCGTYYLDFCSNQAGGDEAKALDRYGTGSGYSKDVMTAEACLMTGGSVPMECLKPIHPFQIERLELGLVDDPTGRFRFIFRR
jgi:hypothetical protein